MMNSERFLAGTAMVDITPPLGTRINGDFISRYAHTIHDRLYSKALAMKCGAETIVLVVVDICYMQDDFLRPIRKEIREQTGLLEKNILFCCTHTHSAGAVTDLLLGAADLPYTRNLPALIIDSVLKALDRLVPAKIAFGAVDVPEHILCRRYFMEEDYIAYNPVTGIADEVKTNPFGAEGQIVGPVAKMDTQLSFLAIKDTHDQWISLFANYSLHYVGDFAPGILSADYFGEFGRQIARVLGADNDFVGILSNGTSGEANIWDFMNKERYPKGDFQKSTFIAKDLAEKVGRTLSDLVWDDQAEVSSIYQELYLPVNKPPKEDLSEAEELIGKTDFGNLMIVNNDVLRKIYAREQVLLAREPNEQVVSVQALKIGNTVIGALAGEFFAETGLWLKENSPVENYFTIGLANGCVGYVPPAHEIERGGYETWRCRTSKLQKGSEEIIRNNLLKLVKQISQ